MIIAPSLLGADLLHLGAEIHRAESWGAEWLHFDHMDGHFVPNISFGPAFVAAVRPETGLFLDVHLMLTDPLQYIEAYADAGADSITVHAEANHASEAVEAIKRKGLRAAIALNPDTPAKEAEQYLGLIDMVLIMTVQPGFGGQKLQEKCLTKAVEINEAIRRSKREVLIEADGGIHADNAESVLRSGVDVLVMGTGLFKAADARKTISSIRNAVRH